MRVATWNIHRGRPAFGPFRPERIVAVLAELDADLVALQEAQHHFDRARPMLDEAALRREAGLRVLRAVAGQQGWRANLLLARDTVRLRAGPKPLLLGGWEPRGGLLALLDTPLGPLRVATAHLSLTPGRRAAQAAILLEALADDPAMPTLLLGDLNEAVTDGALSRLAPRFTLLPPAIATFPSFAPRLALDRVMTAPPGMIARLVAHDTRAARRASDHLPLVAELTAQGPARSERARGAPPS
ncbi:MAG: endonuclease/exonuclease/phosphatase family protein [Acetobacteraceae bacterium]|nr:endonuclease/exonuclease/phosphatase family protein [Acetobacteraceae bacterium]